MKPSLTGCALLLVAACADLPGESRVSAIDPEPGTECYPTVRSCAERRLQAALDPSLPTPIPIDAAFVRALIDECAGVHVTEPTPLLDEYGQFRDDDSFTYSVNVPGAGMLRVRLMAEPPEDGDGQPLRGDFEVWHGTMLLETADCRKQLADGAAECVLPVAGPSQYYVRVRGTFRASYELTVTLEPASGSAPAAN